VPTRVTHNGEGVFFGLDQDLEVARYHSLYAIESALPAELQATARSVDNVIMGISHRTLNIHTVQFHPESIITSKRDIGRRMVQNVLERCLGSR
jgi:anthranilate/para-aminobenzoate synthase component II